ncbi:MAG: endonuclease/exonuclease/phosphatase family protein [Myxococcales bacterium]|nr:endonuclease/exonuclease/phosphatase family protein [Myxococcales bacterium]
MSPRRGGRRRARRGASRRRGRALAGALLGLLIAAYALWGPQIRALLGLGGDASAPNRDKEAQLRVVTWNLRNFPDKKQDLELLRRRLTELDADLIAVQEIKSPEALQALVPGWEVAISEQGGRGHQRLGVIYDPARIEVIGAPREHREVTLGGRVRPALSVYVRGRGGGPDFHLVVVHLKARATGYELRQEQWPALAAIVEDLRKEGPGIADSDVIVVGDFNATGPPDQAAEVELAALNQALGAVGLRRLEHRGGCSAYWDGPRRDAWQEPSLLDLVWVGDLAEATSAGAQVVALGHCARHSCAAFRSTDAYPDLDFARVSDHCPVILDLAVADDDP